MSVKSLSFTKWGNTMVIEPMMKVLQYLYICVCGKIPGKYAVWSYC